MISAKRNEMLRFEVSRVMWDPIGAKNGERERENDEDRQQWWAMTMTCAVVGDRHRTATWVMTMKIDDDEDPE